MSNKRSTHLVWFRNDLRVTDNPALSMACEDPQANVIAVFIATPGQWRQHDMSARQAHFIYDNLLALQQSLAVLGIPLLYQQCDDFTASVDILVTLCQQHAVSKLFYNHQYEFNEQQRDILLGQKLSNSVNVTGCHGNLFLPPLSVLTGNHEMYKVFTPFRQSFLQTFFAANMTVTPKPQPRNHPISQSHIPPFDYPYADYHDLPAGEAAALDRLRHFCAQQVHDYAQTRDRPALDGTSKLSAYLALGIISVKQCFMRLSLENPLFWQDQQSGAFVWFNELIWREFYQHLLVAYPRLSKGKPFIDWTDSVIWQNSPADFSLWQTGMTGYPIVDAAMRQLNQTGWMHNRLRMICASFLVKDLLIDWRWGERYFMSQLTDGDLAANNGGWQWAASTGTDAAPYFRIFNPTTQGERFDTQGDFIRHWLPELAQVPDKFIHVPHSWANEQQKTLDYPLPMVDHQSARKLTLSAYEQAKTI
ncbi:deoxyribodipyrimidine photo-lyase [Utexia brackfieldae]|uniref:deoxyribodipyrimidine photo-lyase n=1 Tax=Utexia brackfieldae TaxID=3074108 RepID=UPI00370DDABF